MTVVFVVLTVLVVAVIGLVVVGRTTAKLAAAPPPALFDLDEAVTFIGDELPFEAAAQLSYDDVRSIVGWHVDYLETRGVAADVGEAAPEASTPGAGPLVAEDDEGVAYVIGRAADEGLEVSDVQIVQVLTAEMAYLQAIGALGTEVEPPRDV